LGVTPKVTVPSEFDRYLHAEAEKWGPILKEANIKLQQ
jgi:tripartite-type tricarboxylate transporter receptor subunit TctC